MTADDYLQQLDAMRGELHEALYLWLLDDCNETRTEVGLATMGIAAACIDIVNKVHGR